MADYQGSQPLLIPPGTIATNPNPGTMVTNPSTAATNVPWPVGREHYALLEVIGHGATAVVQAAMCKPRNEKVALKRINLEKFKTNMDELTREIHAMSLCNHANVVSYYTSFVVRDEMWLVMKLLSKGSLLDIIKTKLKKDASNCKNGVFDEIVIATVLKEVLKALDYLHEQGYIHRDVKAGNILIDEDGTVQLADFGVASSISSGGDRTKEKVRRTFVGTPCWMAPEVMEQLEGYNCKADIWSFGITAIELATGMAPYHKYPPMKVLMLTLQNEPPSIETSAGEKDQYKRYGKTMRRMIAECLHKDPDMRPSAKQLLKNEFFKKAKNKEFIVSHVVDNIPSVLDGGQLAKRMPGASGRLHRTQDGGWEWSDDEFDGETEEGKEALSQRLSRLLDDDGSAGQPAGSVSQPALQTGHPAVSMGQPSGPMGETVVPMGQPAGPMGQPVVPMGQPAVPMGQPAVPIGQPAVPTGQPPVEPVGLPYKPDETMHLVLRLRNTKKELNDIKFEFTRNRDTADGVAQELVGAGLVDGRDSVLIAANLHKLIDRQDGGSITFGLHSGHGGNTVPDEKSLAGFAQLSVTD